MDKRKIKVKRLEAYYERHQAQYDVWVQSGYDPRYRPTESYPNDLQNFQCGATTRAGTPCKRKDIYRNGRCKYHGGMSTGAKTPEGKARQIAGFRRWLEGKRQSEPA